jgi:hypothetical protein
MNGAALECDRRGRGPRGLPLQSGHPGTLLPPAATTLTSAALRHATIVLPDAEERARRGLLGRAAAAGTGAEETAAGPMLTDPSGNRLLLAVG